MIVSLAFVPQQDLLEALTILENYFPNELEPILSYFINTYVVRLRNNGTRAPPTTFRADGMSTQERLITRIAPIIFVKRFIEKFNCNSTCHIRLYGNFWMNYKKL
uniref:Uncharacterized protein n=1 Tax=Meloidogyne enterolobii TaxID=390850 RepID=A0A6V7VZF7_MELEN|nr:unnamed protein product [Meloidogyne enterolobii]